MHIPWNALHISNLTVKIILTSIDEMLVFVEHNEMMNDGNNKTKALYVNLRIIQGKFVMPVQ